MGYIDYKVWEEGRLRMAAVKIEENVFWIGVQDPELKVFDIIMETQYGTTYNAYLIRGSEKTALIETVKEKFFEEYLENIKELINLSEIDYLVLNHTEPDHSGSVARLLQIVPELTVVAHPNSIEFLNEITNLSFKSKAVGNGSKLSLGNRNLHFISALLLHWPDTIYTYLKEEKILFTCDSFGSHYSDAGIFNDRIAGDFSDAYKYYFDVIMQPFKPHVLKALRKIQDLDITCICPGHGPILRRNIDYYLDLYRQWASPRVEEDRRPKIVVAYASAYGYTEKIAQTIEKTLQESGDFNIKKYDLMETPSEQVSCEMENADGLLIGSPTINKDMVHPVWELLGRLSPIVHKGKVASAFGAYGWSGEAVPGIQQRLISLRMKVMKGLRIRFNPSEEQVEKIVVFAREFGQAVKNKDIESLEDHFIGDVSDDLYDGKGEYIKEYRNQDLVVYWNPKRCMHDTHCFIGLPQVFDPEARPWVNMDGASSTDIIKAIDRCPSGALKYSIPKDSRIDPALVKGPGLMK